MSDVAVRPAGGFARVVRSSKFGAVSSLFGTLSSRVATLVVLVLAARTLGRSDFGVFVAVYGVSIGVSSVASTAAGSVLGYWAVGRPVQVAKVASVTSVAAVVLCVAAILELLEVTQVGTLGSATLLIVSSFGALASMQMLRGLDSLPLAAAAGFALPALSRVVFTLMAGGSPSVAQLLAATTLACGVGTLFGALAAREIARRKSCEPSQVSTSYAWTPSLSAAALTVGFMWLVLGQADVVALTATHGSGTAGDYAPMMRAFEALNALGQALVFVAIRKFSGADQLAIRRTAFRVVRVGFALVIVAAAPLIAFGQQGLEGVLGRSIYWTTGSAIALTFGYACNVAMAVMLEAMIAGRHRGALWRSAVAVGAAGVVIVPLGAALAGAAGAAAGNAAAYALGAFIVAYGLRRATATPTIANV